MDSKKTSFDVNGKTFEIQVSVDPGRFNKQFQQAQFQLDSTIMTDMLPYMPMQKGRFINETKARSAAVAGTGEICAGAPPSGRFLYEGKTMVDEKTGSPWARKDAKKVLVSQYSGKTNAKPDLTYANGRQSHWFEAAKKNHIKEWIQLVKKTAGGGA